MVTRNAGTWEGIRLGERGTIGMQVSPSPTCTEDVELEPEADGSVEPSLSDVRGEGEAGFCVRRETDAAVDLLPLLTSYLQLLCAKSVHP